MKIKTLLHPILIALCFSFSGCTSSIMGAGSSVGLVALEERSARTVAKDIALAARIRLNLIESKKDFLLGIGIEVFESRVLITGIVKNPSLAAEAISLAWREKGVRDVLNEIQIGEISIRNLAKDSWVSAQLTSKITLDRDIFAINYKVETVNGVLYLIGVAQSSVELKKVEHHAKGLRGVNRIINHVRVKQ